jgi:D-3-phosphoglycerate dehydrogenase
MPPTSLDKGKIKILLLEGVHPSATEAFRRDGYTNLEEHPKSLTEPKLASALRDTYVIGIRSSTRLTAQMFASAPRLIGVGCFCIGTNQVDLDAATEAGVPVFNAPFSNTRSVAELVLAEIIMLLRGIPQRNTMAHRGVLVKERGWIL